MKSTMQDAQLTIGSVMKHGTTVHADSEVVTATADGTRSQTYAELGTRAAQLAHGAARARDRRRPAGRDLPVEQRRAPRGLPRGPVDGRGAPHAQHPALPRPARLHRQPRRGPGRHRRRLARRRCSPRSCRSSKTVTHVLVAGPDAAVGRPRLAARHRQGGRCSTRTCSPTQPEEFDWPEVDERDAAAMCYTSGTTGQPQGRRLQPPVGLAALAGGEHRQRRRPRLPRPGAADRADVPRQRLGTGLRRADDRRVAVHARPLAPGRAAGAGSSRRAGPPSRARCRPSGTTCSPTSTSTPRTYARLAPADPVRRLRRPRRAAEGARGAPRPRRPAGLGHDRDLAGRLRRPASRSASRATTEWTYRGSQGRLLCGVEGRIVGDDGSAQPWDGTAVGELEVRGPVGDRRLLQLRRPRGRREVPRRLAAHRRRRHPRRRSATSRSPTAPRT